MDLSGKNGFAYGVTESIARECHTGMSVQKGFFMKFQSENSSLSRSKVFAAFCVALTLMCSGITFAEKVFVENEVIIIGKNFVKSMPDAEGVVLESKKGTFKPTRFMGVEGTAAMLFLYNRITRDMGVDLLLKTYKDKIDRNLAEDKVDLVLQFYKNNDLIFKSRFVEKPATKIAINRYKI